MRPAALFPALLTLVLAANLAAAPPAVKPNEKEWSLLQADYQWLETLRAAQKLPPPGASRKQQIEVLIENHKRIEPTYVAFIDKLSDYFDRTADPRAVPILAKEKIAIGDEYMNVLARYDRAIEQYREALKIDPANVSAQQRITEAERRRFVSMTSFAGVKNGMKEDDVRTAVGMPREDWIKHVLQNSRVYSVWIYPKADGGAAAIYFDNGTVYHTNWNAAAPAARTK